MKITFSGVRVLRHLFCIIAILVLAVTASGTGNDTAPKSPADFFPDLEGWTKDGDPAIYTPETLFEYIDGEAHSYLAYDFEELATQSYDSGADTSITVDIYRQGTPNDGFGIYSQERSTDSTFLPIGAQGYHDKGVLNFFKGRYYVKVMAFGLGKGEVQVLSSLAETIAERLDGTTEMPLVLKCLPENGKQDKSERYIAQEFLGHGFLHSAFIAEYEVLRGDRPIPFQMFIIEAADEAGAQEMLARYREHAKTDPLPESDTGRLIRLADPYYASKGMLNMMTKGKYIWGLFGDDPAIYVAYLTEAEQLLAKNGLVQL